MKKLLLMIGPQGAGNHLFSKMFARNPKVGGWKNLTNVYWEGHHTEPFFEVWTKQRPLSLADFDGFDYWVTSASIPMVHDGDHFSVDVLDFYKQAEELGIDVQIAVITRDVNILKNQQARVRGLITYSKFEKTLNEIDQHNIDYHIFSHESYALLGIRYARYCANTIGFPNEFEDVSKDIEDNANHKYFIFVHKHWLDDEVRATYDQSRKR